MEPTAAGLPTPPPPRRPRGGGVVRTLEVALFVVVFAAGSVLAAFAVSGGPKKVVRAAGAGSPPASVAPATPTSLPTAVPTTAPPSPTTPVATSPPFIPSIPPPPSPILGPMVQFTSARSEGRPNGCQAQLFFTWDVDRSTAPPGKPKAVIKVTGPAKAGRYTRPLAGGQVKLELVVPLGSSDDRWTADVVSVGDRKAFPTPLEVSFNVGFC